MRRSACRVALIILAFLLLSTTDAARSYGQKLYVFCEANDRAPDVGAAVKVAADSLKEALMGQLPSDFLIVYNERDSLWRGPDIHSSDDVARDILVAIEECPATPQDSIFFYWSGHAAFDARGHYLSVPKGTGRDDARDVGVLRRRAIVDALQSKGARLTVLFTDSCNSPLDAELNFPPPPPEDSEDSDRFSSFAAKGRDNRDEKPNSPWDYDCPFLRSLFFIPKGFIDFNSSRPGQRSWSQSEKGGYCTQILVNSISQPSPVAELGGVGWPEVFDELNSGLREATEQGSESLGLSQEIFCWSAPPARGGEKWGTREDRWSEPIYQPKPGDRIVAVDGYKVDTEDQLNEYLNPIDGSSKSADPSMPDDRSVAVDENESVPDDEVVAYLGLGVNFLDVEQPNDSLVRVHIFTLVDGKDGSTFFLMADLESASDLGYTFASGDDRGAVVQSVAEGASGAKCRFFK